jgi:hypothetical protein
MKKIESPGPFIEMQEDGTRIITPRHILREKIGSGGIDPIKLRHAQDYLDHNNVNFEPYAHAFLDRLAQAIADARNATIPDRTVINAITRPIVDLKANGGMFQYKLLAEIADILMNFLEEIPELNDDTFNLLDVNFKTMSTIIKNRLTGDGGPSGKALADELYQATRRYRKKHPVKKAPSK